MKDVDDSVELDKDVDVLVTPSLPAKERIHAPSARRTKHAGQQP